MQEFRHLIIDAGKPRSACGPRGPAKAATATSPLMQAMPDSFLIIGGAEKAGTTSLFTYLSAHPDVCPSSRKETDHFRGPGADLRSYLTYFAGERAGARVYLESSPAYLAEAQQVAPRLASLTSAHIVFLLRDPIDRLKSSFRFYKSRLHVPEGMSFEAFVTVCAQFEDGVKTAADVGIQEWHLLSMRRGRYESQLPFFEAALAPANLHIVLHEDLRDRLVETVKTVAGIVGLDGHFYDNYAFGRENVSFLAKRRGLQRVAIFVNDRFESIWRRHPGLKKRLLALYKRVNEKPLDPDPLSPETAEWLRDYYAPTYALLEKLRRQGQRG